MVYSQFRNSLEETNVCQKQTSLDDKDPILHEDWEKVQNKDDDEISSLVG